MQNLLRTKLYIPPVPSETIARPRLVELLNLAMVGKLSLVMAPAGYGKTTLVTSWLHQLPETEAVWLSLDEGDNDLRRFFTHVVAALCQLDEIFEVTKETFLQDSRSELSPTAIVTSLLNQAMAYAQSAILVLDDYHEIEEPQIHEALSFWLDNQPPNVHLVITSRTEPPLPLPRMRVRRQVAEIDAAALRFSQAESAEFLNQHMHLDLSTEDIAQLDAITEGWVASLQLAALSLQNKDDPTEFIQTFKGDNRYIVDYLVTEVLQRQPEYLRDFLLQTSILERMNVQLCNAVTEQVGSQQILETLDQSRLFVIPLDDQRHWYRYHHLFAECLQAELRRTAPQDVAVYHERASRWLSDQGYLGEAIQHAFAAGDDNLAADLIAFNARTMLWEQGQTQQPWQWIEQLPNSVIQARPQLLITKAWLYQELFLDHSSHVEKLLDDARQLIHAHETSFTAMEIAEMGTEVALGKANLARLKGNLQDAIQGCKDAWELIKDVDSPILRNGALHSLTISSHQAGNVIQSLEYSTIQFETHRKGGQLDYAHYVSLAYRIDALRLHGDLQQAELEFRQFVSNHLTPLSIGAAMAAVSWAEILRERSELASAAEMLNRVLETIRPLQSMAIVVQTAAITLARIYQAQGNGQEALQLLRETLSGFGAPDVYYPSARVSATAALLHLRQGNLAAAKAWADTSGLLAEDTPTYLLEIDYLVLARVLIADGAAQAAQLLLAKLEKEMAEGGRVARLIEVHTLQAFAHKALGKSELALGSLGEAITLAEKGGFTRVLVDEGHALVPLLKQIAGRGVAIGYIRQLLPLFDDKSEPRPLSTLAHANADAAATTYPPTEQRPTHAAPDSLNLLLNPLTDRELATLRYLASDLSIPEIAEQMIVAPSTIRTYVKRVYSKLDVHNRIEAVNRARSLALIS